MSSRIVSYPIELEIPESYIGNLLDFIYRKYLQPQKERFADISRTDGDSHSSLSFGVLDESRHSTLKAEIIGIKPLKVNIEPLSDTVTEEQITEVRQDVLIAVELFEEKVRESTLFFAWREGEDIVPEESSGREKKSLNRIFLETQILLFVVFITLGLFLFYLLPPSVALYTPIILLIVQFIFVVFSPKIIERTADWHITKDNPIIHLLEYSLPFEEHDDFRENTHRRKSLKSRRKYTNEQSPRKEKLTAKPQVKSSEEMDLNANLKT